MCAAFVYVHCGFSCFVIVLVQATRPGPPMPTEPVTELATGVEVTTGGAMVGSDAEHDVTVVKPGSMGAGVGQIIMQWMPVVTEVMEHPVECQWSDLDDVR